MATALKNHKFELNLPLYPNQPEEGELPVAIKMDGKKLEGVTSLFVKADSNGYTNVTLGFEADSMVSMTAVLVAKMEQSEELDEMLGGVLLKVLREKLGGNPLKETNATVPDLGLVVRQLIEVLFEELIPGDQSLAPFRDNPLFEEKEKS